MVEDLKELFRITGICRWISATGKASATCSNSERPDFVIHAAAQPSHDKAARIPYDDFDVNAVGTMNLLVAARDFCPESPFCFTSTNKVYGDRPNTLPLIEQEKRYDYAGGLDGIDESMSIDGCLHSIFGASKVAADVMCQEFGRYFQHARRNFRCGCLTGPQTGRGGTARVSGVYHHLRGYRPPVHDLRLSRESRYATRSIAATWRACSWNSIGAPGLPKSTTWAADGRTACRFWKPSTCWPAWVSTCGISTRRKTASAITSAIFPIYAKCSRISRIGDMEYDLPKIVNEIVERHLRDARVRLGPDSPEHAGFPQDRLALTKVRSNKSN